MVRLARRRLGAAKWLRLGRLIDAHFFGVVALLIAATDLTFVVGALLGVVSDPTYGAVPMIGELILGVWLAVAGAMILVKPKLGRCLFIGLGVVMALFGVSVLIGYQRH
jgi:hypothetical protein